ncbi:phosphate/phosphite/phosphonate ABC transporter substrate-binding protein [Candidatus Electronema sp. PJ]|uniref:phosphate/phosphite/phosphonate ABC transporter substrate-binding protein n=1 Tax=Candidatus Electronema sp. PJ TaxID=3401572 RepID=UPI003AA9A163
MKKIAFVLLTLLCSASVQAEELSLSIQPVFPPEKLTAMLAPLAEKLSVVAKRNVRPMLTKNSAEYETELLRGKIAIGYQSPLLYVKAADRHEVLVTAVEGKNGTQLRGIVISRPETGIAKASDLKGKRIMIVGKNSAGGYLSQKQTLKEAGLKVEQDCQLIEATENREENVIIAVSLGETDAGFITESALHKADDYIVPGSVTEVMKTAPLPNWALSVNRALPQDLKESLQAALTGLPENDPALAALGISGFKAAQDADYNPVRSLAE